MCFPIAIPVMLQYNLQVLGSLLELYLWQGAIYKQLSEHAVYAQSKSLNFTDSYVNSEFLELECRSEPHTCV